MNIPEDRKAEIREAVGLLRQLRSLPECNDFLFQVQECIYTAQKLTDMNFDDLDKPSFTEWLESQLNPPTP